MPVQGGRTQHGKPQRWAQAQPDAREGQAGPRGVADRPVVPRKPGNAGGGKGPDFGSAVAAGMARGVADRPSTPAHGPGPAQAASPDISSGVVGGAERGPATAC